MCSAVAVSAKFLPFCQPGRPPVALLPLVAQRCFQLHNAVAGSPPAQEHTQTNISSKHINAGQPCMITMSCCCDPPTSCCSVCVNPVVVSGCVCVCVCPMCESVTHEGRHSKSGTQTKTNQRQLSTHTHTCR